MGFGHVVPSNSEIGVVSLISSRTVCRHGFARLAKRRLVNQIFVSTAFAHRDHLELAVRLRMELVQVVVEPETVPSDSGRSCWDERHEKLWKVHTDFRRPVLDSCLLYTSPSPRDQRGSRMPSSA